MKWFHLLPVAAVLTLAASVLADEVIRPNLAAKTQSGLPLQTTARGQTWYADYPAEAYPAGFSSYRGTGFMGSCCEQKAPAAARLWTDYCETKDHHAKLFDDLGHGWKRGGCKPSCVPVAGGGGSGCCGPSANFWPKNPGLPPIGERLRCLKANVCGLFPSLHAPSAAPNCNACAGEGRAAPTPAADPVPAAPAPPDAPAPPAPTAETDPAPVPPSLPAPPAPPTADQTTHTQPTTLNAPLGASFKISQPSSQDKSASRMEPRVLRAWSVSF